jgi:LysW-gamma-L-lysine carboxypeptidase
VIKVGSSTLTQSGIFGEIAAVADTGSRLLVVCGGAAGIERHYAAHSRAMPRLRLTNGDEVRYCPPEEMPHIVAAYHQATLPLVRAGLAGVGLTAFADVAAGGLVTARVNRPLRVVHGGRTRLVRDHRAGTVASIRRAQIEALLQAFDVVCLAPPVADVDGGTPLNIDADVLASTLACELQADHLRLVTGSAGLLGDPADPRSTVPSAFAGTAMQHAAGRMRQKVRAAEQALSGGADVAISGPHSMLKPKGQTRFWRTREPAADLALLSRTVQIPSVSGDERLLAQYLQEWCAEHRIEAWIDEVGNIVAERGDGPRTLLLMGHLDTVPFTWPAFWDGETLSGRGSVDAKASLAQFFEVLRDAEIPAGWRLRVVGAVEEEVSSSRGAFHVRDTCPADAVVIGEPSSSTALTIGYYGLFKLRITAAVASGHSAGKEVTSAPDALVGAVERIRGGVLACAPEALSSVIDLRTEPGLHHNRATAVLNFRVPPAVNLDDLRAAVATCQPAGIGIEHLRATPAYVAGRGSALVRAFTRAFRQAGVRPRFLVKKGTADMNTLATAWHDVPMVAYGPGDSALDHTQHERIEASEYRAARAILAHTVAQYFTLHEGATP